MLAILGLCRGFHTNTRTVGQNSFTDNAVLVEVEQPNQYGLMEVKTVAVKLSKKHMELGLNNLWNQYRDKPVSVPVFVGAWASKSGNAGFDLWLSGDGKPLGLQLVSSVEKSVSSVGPSSPSRSNTGT